MPVLKWCANSGNAASTNYENEKVVPNRSVIHPTSICSLSMENRAEHLIESYFANTLSQSEADELKILVSTDLNVAAELAFQQKVATKLTSRSLD